MSDSDDDLDLLANLLAKTDDDETPTPNVDKISQESKSSDTLQKTAADDKNSEEVKLVDKVEKTNTETTSTQSKSNALKELDFNFLDDVALDDLDGVVFEDLDDSAFMKSKPEKKSRNGNVFNEENEDSSDDEDKKYFEKQRYSEYGKGVKRLMKIKQSEPSGYKITYQKGCFKSSSNSNDTSLSDSFKSKVESPSLSSSFSKLAETPNKHCLQVSSSPKTPIKKDVYSDPIFGIRIVKPIISSTELIDRMEGRKAVTVSGINMHLSNKKESKEDWVIAGVIMYKSPPRVSQKGKEYIVFKITDLSMDMNAVSIFLFSGAYKQFFGLPTHTVIAILNPNVMENKESKDLAVLSVDAPQKMMVLGLSKDLGKCRSMKKDGQPCTAPVNLRRCEYCVYHVKQEYGKFSNKRSDLQGSGLMNNIGKPNGIKKQSTSMYHQQRNTGDTRPFVAIPAKRDEVQIKKDSERLALLQGKVKAVQTSTLQQKFTAETKVKMKATTIEVPGGQTKKDLERLSKLLGGQSAVSLLEPEKKKPEVKLNLSAIPTPKLGSGIKNGIIDFSEPSPKNQANKAKLSAIAYVQKNGGFKRTNPNRLRASREVLNEKGQKRRREDEEEEKKNSQVVVEEKKAVRNRFQEMLEKQSAHSDLIKSHEDEETEKYFNKLEAKERMEEKMLTTFKVACKAVRCNICKYVAFSSSDMCKKLQHPIKVIDAVKRFFKCADCGYRTVSLDRIPTETCKRCASSHWVKTAMMDEKRTEVVAGKLCIRGAEEKFIGSSISSASLDLCVPDTD